MSQPRATSEPAEIAGRYTVVQKLGAGAFGTVYKAKDKILGRMLAIKTIRLEGLAAQGASLEELMSRFKQEAMVSAQLKHPNIVTIYDIGEADGMSYLAMEFIDGVGLERIIAQAGRLPLERAASLAAQVADALDFAHKHSVVHRDIKPANIMVEAGDRVKVTDFGIAKVTTSGDHLTMTGSLLGTPSYMSPEQARGAQLDGRSDLFAVGCVLYEMLTGKKAFRGESITGLIFKIITEEPVPIRELEPGIPEEVARIISKALAKAPELRYQTGRELAGDLGALVRPGSTPTIRQAEVATSPGLASPPTAVVAGVPTLQAPPTIASPAPTKIAPPPAIPAERPAPPPPAATQPRAGKKGSALPLIALAVVFLLFAGIATVAAWFLFLKKPEGSNVAQTTTAAPLAPPTAPSATAPDATVAPAVTASPATEAAAPPPSTTAAAAAASTRPVTRPPVERPPATAREAPPAASVQKSFLDEEPVEAGPDGAEAGRRLAEGYRGGSSSGSSFGATGRFQQRERTPRSLAPVERPAVATMRHVIDAEEAFYRRNNRYGSLLEMQKAGTLFVDVPIQPTAFLRKGYRFEISVEGGGFRLAAVPLTPGSRPFVADDSGLIRPGVD